MITTNALSLFQASSCLASWVHHVVPCRLRATRPKICIASRKDLVEGSGVAKNGVKKLRMPWLELSAATSN